MKKILCFIAFLLLLPITQAKTAVFVSRYSSPSMDTNTLDYYDKIDDTFTVVPIQDKEVKKNSTSWINAYEDAELIFVMSLSDEMFNESRNTFCKNLAIVLTEIKGIVFAGNSSISDTIFGCPYTSYFNLASLSNNLELKNGSVKLIRTHQITDGYGMNESYYVTIQDTIYTVPSVKDGTILGTVRGDPDGAGSCSTGDYPFLVVWDEVGHRSAIWGINTSTLTGCDGCLGWDLFDQLLEWVSNTSDIGYKISTDKETYYPEQRINVYIESPANIDSVSGRIYYPNKKNYTLSFLGSGKEWNSIYLLDREDPSGNYTIEVIADGVKKYTSVEVKAFDLNIDVDNSTEKVRVGVNATDRYGDMLKVNITVNITSPKGQKTNYYFEGNGSISFIYDVQNSGKHTIDVTAIDEGKRSVSESKIFYYFYKPNITITPDNITEIVYEPINFTVSITVFNNGSNNVTNAYIRKTGDVKDWIELENTSLGDIEPNERKTFRLDISVPDIEIGDYTGTVKFLFDGDEYSLPVSIRMKYMGNLSVNPVHWSTWIPKGQSKTTRFFLSNSGKGEVIIESIDITDDLTDKVSIIQQPSQIEPGLNETLEIKVSTTDVRITDLVKTLIGDIEITTDQGLYSTPISLEVKVVEDLTVKTQDLSADLIDLEDNITELGKSIDVSSFEDDLAGIKSDLSDAEDLYNKENYQDAVSLYRSVESDVDELRTNIIRTYTEIKEREEMFSMIITVFIVLIVVGIIAVFIFRKIREKGRYSWLYRKWKGRKTHS